MDESRLLLVRQDISGHCSAAPAGLVIDEPIKMASAKLKRKRESRYLTER